MNNKNDNTASGFKKHLPLLLSAALILTGIFYIISAVHLFFTGGAQPYTRERVGEYLLILALPSFITLILAIAAAVVYRGRDNGIYKGKALDAFKMKASLEKLRAGFDIDSAPENVKNRIAHERERRRDTLVLAFTVTALALIPSLITVFDFGSYTIENLNGDIAAAAFVILGNCASALLSWGVYAMVCFSAAEEEILLIKTSVKEDPSLYRNQDTAKAPSKSDNPKLLFGIRCAAVAAALILILLGIFNGGMADVLDKAVKICTECIGLG